MANRPQPITLSTQIITEIYTNMHVTARKLEKLYFPGGRFNSWELDVNFRELDLNFRDLDLYSRELDLTLGR